MWASNSGKPDENGTMLYGMTSPITTATPKPIDISRNRELEEVLASYDVTETEDELNHRYVSVFTDLYSILYRIFAKLLSTIISGSVQYLSTSLYSPRKHRNK